MNFQIYYCGSRIICGGQDIVVRLIEKAFGENKNSWPGWEIGFCCFLEKEHNKKTQDYKIGKGKLEVDPDYG